MTYVEPADREARLNTHAWDVARAEVLREQSYLCPCGKRADVVHHIVEIKDGGAAGEKSNLEGLCIACHFNKHRKVPDTLRPSWDKLLK